MVRGKLIAAVLLTLVASNSGAQERRSHRNGEKLGKVRFATSCNEVAKREFNRAVTLTLIPPPNPPGLGRSPRNVGTSLSGQLHGPGLAALQAPFSPDAREILLDRLLGHALCHSRRKFARVRGKSA